MSPQHLLIVMRLADMHVVHPEQDNSRVCPDCKEPVGIYPSGQHLLEAMPALKFVCSHCCERCAVPDITILAPGARKERSESVPRATKKRS